MPLAMFVTRSSALSLQAKQGLPVGNQIVGWAVLGISTSAMLTACLLRRCGRGPVLTRNVVVSLFMPLAYRLQSSTHYMHRLAVIFLTCAPTFVILTISYEGLFYVAFSITLLLWVRLEYAVETQVAKASLMNGAASGHDSGRVGSPKYRPLRLSDARVALFFMVLLQSAFFSTGNVASVSSFSLESVTRLIPIFDPFSQGALLILSLIHISEPTRR